MSKDIFKPFDKELFKKASILAKEYHISTEKYEGLYFVGHCVEMPMILFDGKTEEKCRESGVETITVAIATMLEMGNEKHIPKPNKKKNTRQQLSDFIKKQRILIDNLTSFRTKK